MIKVVALFVVKEGRDEEMERHLRSVIKPTRQEAGCHTYDLYRDPQDVSRFMFDEMWESRDHLKAHSRSAHILAMREATSDLVVSRDVYVLDKVA